MEYKKIALEEDFSFTDIKSINERLFLFQLSDKDLEKLDYILKNNNQLERFIFKEKKIINAFEDINEEQKSKFLSIILTYLESLRDVLFSDDYYQKRKKMILELDALKINNSLFSAAVSRIAENFIYFVFDRHVNNNFEKQDLFEEVTCINNFFNFEKDLFKKLFEETETNATLNSINRISENFIKLDFLPDLTDSLNYFETEIASVTKNTTDLKTSNKAHSKKIQKLIEMSTLLTHELDENKLNIEMTIDDIFTINNDFRKTEATINDLVMNIRTINSIIVAIKSISEQTTLLAINASIEASRAEAEGKGFSVIAEEIRNLSEQTTDSVEKITNIIQKFEENTFRLEKNTKDVIGRMNQKSKNTESALESLNSIFDVSNTLLSTIQFANKEVTNIDSNAKNILEHSNRIRLKIDVFQNSLTKLGQDVFDSAADIFKTKEIVEQNIKFLRHSELLKLFTLNARKIYWDLYNKIVGISDNGISIKEYDDYFTNYYISLMKNSNITELGLLSELKSKHDSLMHEAEKIIFISKKEETFELFQEMQAFKKLIREFNTTCDTLTKFI